jgi:hypothetical protein
VNARRFGNGPVSVRRLAALIAAITLLLAGCTQTVSGHAASGGSSAPPSSPSGSGTTSVPPSGESGSTSSSAPPAAHLACPHVVDPISRLSYDCAAGSMVPGRSSLWPVEFEKEVDVHWTMDQGSGLLVGQSPADAASRTTLMMIREFYGTPLPTTKKEQDVALTVSGAKAHLVQTLITLNPSYRSSQHLKVAHERLWVVAVQQGTSRIAGWYISVPDLQKQLWPAVPNLIKGIKVV